MKKLILIFTLIFMTGISIAFGEDLSKDDYFYFNLNWTSSAIVTPDLLLEVCTEGDLYNDYMTRENVMLSKDGWFYFAYLNPMILGFHNVVFWSGEFTTAEYEKNRGLFYNQYFAPVYKVTSQLKEDTKEGPVIYKAENLGRFAYASGDHYSPFAWNFEGKPWVEGVQGFGIGEKISLSTKEPFHEISILNGYVCPQKPELYKKNSRVKTFSVRDLDNNQEYIFNLEDVVEFQYYKLRKNTKNIELTIKAVYEGEKWDDTCVTAIVPENTYSFEGEDTSVAFEQSFTYKKDKNKVLERIERIKSTYAHMRETSSEFDGK